MPRTTGAHPESTVMELNVDQAPGMPRRVRSAVLRGRMQVGARADSVSLAVSGPSLAYKTGRLTTLNIFIFTIYTGRNTSRNTVFQSVSPISQQHGSKSNNIIWMTAISRSSI